METIEDFYRVIETAAKRKVDYCVIFNKDTGEITGVGPSFAFKNYTNKLEISSDLALEMLNSRVKMSSYMVDFENGDLQLIENTTLIKIDDVLHRIPEKKWADFEDFDLYVTADTNKNLISFEFSENLGGTKKTQEKIKQKKMKWEGQSTMDFYITEYNDPNIFYYVFTLTIFQLQQNKIEFDNIEFPKKFSVYTRRLFKNYVLEIL